VVGKVGTDETNRGWADLAIDLRLRNKTVTHCAVCVALPMSGDDNPW